MSLSPPGEVNQPGPDAAQPRNAADRRGTTDSHPVDPRAALSWRLTDDGSPSLWSEAFGQAFHCRSGALAEARAKFIRPAQLERCRPGDRLRVVEVCVGLGYNTAALLEAASDQGLALEWWGLELDPRPLALALADGRFRRLWRPATLEALDQLHEHGHWRLLPIPSDAGISAGCLSGPPRLRVDPEGLGESLQATSAHPLRMDQAGDPGLPSPRQSPSRGRWWLGDARQQLGCLPAALSGGCDLVFLDAFSPARCPQLWTQEFLGRLAELLRPQGRLLTYCTAAAVRRALELAGLRLASLRPDRERPEGGEAVLTRSRDHWSVGTVASPTPLATDASLRPLSDMEREHLLCRAAVPYRDPRGCAEPAMILAQRSEEQQRETGQVSTSAWRRRWGLDP
ncbi:MAG: MnmC family methyltransferase [Synechococcaceae cyanobacterium]|nr:MnmC family methyltransferase [Synechococcaceae cyanobacterium]